MPLYYSIPVFLASLAVVLGGSVFLSRLLGRLGSNFRIPEQFLGFIAAFGADSPEITSAVVAMISGQTNVGVGIVFGSNLFNLASLLGLAAVLSGGISVRRQAALLAGGVGALITAIAVALVLGVAGPELALGAGARRAGAVCRASGSAPPLAQSLAITGVLASLPRNRRD
jgi:cation:H+ antiporter